ncbi:MAG: EcsC family protein [Atopobiaceae bacterium]|nr:EcsC family protein [Atopobiaceae bacterium]
MSSDNREFTQQDSSDPTQAEQGQDDLLAQVVDATKDVLGNASDAYRETFDQFKSSLPTFDEILSQAIRLPGTSVDRSSYLTEVIGAKHAPLIVRASIETTPRKAGLSPRDIEKIAKKSLGKDGRRTTALSFAAGIPGGVAGAVTIPADLVQFYGYLIRAIQKLSYLYGWRDLIHIDTSQTDVATAAAIMIMLGVMAEVQRADDALARLARLRASGADDTRLRTALAARAMQDEVNTISEELTRRMARRLTGQVAGKAIPVVGGIVSGFVTGSGFDEMSKRLLKELKRCGE